MGAVVACFFGGLFLANGLPHLGAGLFGRRLPTPFASPPFRGLSSPGVNLAWGLVNLGVAGGLLGLVAGFDAHRAPHWAAAVAGFALMAVQFARSLKRGAGEKRA